MKKYTKTVFVALLFSIAVGSCKGYLDVPVESKVTEADVFTTFKGYQGFIEYMYTQVIDYNKHALTTTGNIGGEVIGSGTMGWTSGYKAMRGTYTEWIGNQLHSNYNASAEKNTITDLAPTGEWPDSWKGIRTANKAIANIEMFKGTEEQKKILLGQAYFFRAYFHFTLIQTWGGMPYIDKFIDANVDLGTMAKRLTFQEDVEKIVKDLDVAIGYLPSDWDDTEPGKLTAGANIGKIVKGTALAYKAKAYLYAGSPLQNGFSGGTFEYNKPLMEKAALAAWETIKWAEETGKSKLTPWADYTKMFARNDGGIAWTNEVLLTRILPIQGQGLFDNKIARNYSCNRTLFGGGTNANIDCLNQLYADRFEMADGTLYKPGNSAQGGYDDVTTKRWENRDPRFRINVYVDGDMAGIAASTKLQLYDGGSTRAFAGGAAQRTPYVIKKWWPKGVNQIDKLYTNYNLHTPKMRLADVYLMYAEAVTVAYGPTAKASGANLTAVEAVNKVRNRAGMPNATADAPGYKHQDGDAAAAPYSTFLELIRNERFVELCFEGLWRYDMARWYILHLDQNRKMVDLRFDKDYKSFNRVQIDYMTFENPKHYWFPISRTQTQIFADFPQNPGWN